MNDWYNDTPEDPEPPECCGDFMHVQKDGSCCCVTCGKCIVPAPDIDPPDEIQPDEIQPDEIQPDEIQPDEIQPELFAPPPAVERKPTRFGLYKMPPKKSKFTFGTLVCVVMALDKAAGRRTLSRHGLGIGPGYEMHPITDDAFRRMWDYENR